jgi:electron transfer flavoprotein alpha subunit
MSALRPSFFRPAIRSVRNYNRNVQLRNLLSTLAVLEHREGALNPISRNTITAAKKLGGEVTAFIAGSEAKKVAAEAGKLEGVDKVLVAESSAYDRVGEVPRKGKDKTFELITN